MRRGLVGTLVTAALLALAPGVAQAADGTVKALTFQVKVGPSDEQTCSVSADLYTPAGVSQANPAPAVLATNGFGGSKADFQKLAAAYMRRGYVFLAYSGLGFGGSGCKITLDDPDYDGKAGSQLVSFLGGSKAAEDGTKIDYVKRDATAHDGSARSDDPRVGMIGGSYGGEIQFAVAGIDPRMDALVPQITWNDLSYSLSPNNTSFTSGVTYGTPGVVKLDWPVLFFGVGVGDGLSAALQDPSHVGVCPNFADEVCPALINGAARGYLEDVGVKLLRHASVATYVNRIKIPVFLTQGESDNLFDLQESVATYKALRAQGTPTKLLWRSSGHSGGDIGTAENDPDNPEKAYESRMDLEWFDHYLKDSGPQPPLDFSFLTDWLPYKGDAAPSVGSAPSYPVAADQRTFLSGTSELATDQGAVKPGQASMVALPGAPTSTGGGVASPSGSDQPGTSVSYDLPLDHDLDLAGVPSLTFRADAPTFAATTGVDPATDLELFAKLYDVAPDGNATLPRNLVSAARVADPTKPITIELPGLVHRFAKGHTLRLTISTSSLTFRSSYGAGPVTILTDPANPGVLTLPRLGAPSGPLGSGPSGTTPFGSAVAAAGGGTGATKPAKAKPKTHPAKHEHEAQHKHGKGPSEQPSPSGQSVAAAATGSSLPFTGFDVRALVAAALLLVAAGAAGRRVTR